MIYRLIRVYFNVKYTIDYLVADNHKSIQVFTFSYKDRALIDGKNAKKRIEMPRTLLGGVEG